MLASELLAMRQMIAFVGSGTEVIAIIISAVLLPLAAGYHTGGSLFRKQFSAKVDFNKRLSVRKLLLRNFLCAMAVLTFGLSYPVLVLFMDVIFILGIKNHIVLTIFYCGLFLVYPVYLLGQTVPLISHYFSGKRQSESTGRMLFFSTAGSFLGSVLSTLILMNTVGVHNTVIITLSLLLLSCVLLTKKLSRFDNAIAAALLALAILFNSNTTMQNIGILSNNNYNTVSVVTYENEGSKELIINGSRASKYAPNPSDRYHYTQFIEKTFIPKNAAKPRNILIIGAGGFTIGYEDGFNHYTYIDIDKDLKMVAEKYLLPQPLLPNKQFIPKSARDFLRNHTHEKYDLIISDLYTNTRSIPMEATTREYLLALKAVLNEGGVIVSNIICRPDMGDKFSRRYANTFASVFPSYTRQIVTPFTLFEGADKTANVLHIYFDKPLEDDATVYTDDKTTFSLDR